MTIENLVELIHVAVNGGKPSPDVEVERIDIRQWMNASVAKFYADEFFRRWSMSRGEDVKHYRADPDMCVLKELPVSEVSDCKYTATLSPRMLSLPFTKGLRAVYTKDQSKSYVISTPNTIRGIEDIMSDAVWYSNTAGSDTVNFVGNPQIDTCLVEYVPHIDEMGDTEELPLPSGLEEALIVQAREFFLGVRQVPADKKIDESDDSQR